MLIAGGYKARLSGQMRRVEGDITARLEQLGSGRRINRAADDPAGLAIATSLRVRFNSREVAMRNTEEGLLMAGMADAGLRDTSNLLSRMRELAVQAASETVTDTERAYIQDEFVSLLDEVDRNSQSVVYNGEPVISPPGVDVGLLIDTSGSMGGEKNKVQAALQSFIDQFTAAHYNIRVGVAAYAITADAVDNVSQVAQLGSGDIIADIGAMSLGAGPVDPYAAMTETTGITRIQGTDESDRFSFRQSSVKMLVLVTDAQRSANRNGMDESETGAALAAEDFQVHTITPGGALHAYDDIVSQTGGSSHDIGNSAGSGIAAALDAIAADAIDALDSDESVSVHVGPGADDLIVTPFPLDATLLGLDIADIAVDTRDGARAALDRLDAATSTLGGLQGQVGATQSRLSCALSLSVSALEAEVSAESRIRDQDHARAATALSTAQIQQQSLVAAATAARQLDRSTSEKLLG